MKKITSAGRILFALPFAIFGINHFVMMDYYTGMLTSFIPMGAYTIIITGILMILTSISIMTKKYIVQSTIILASLLFLFIVTIHIPNLINSSDINATRITLIALLKDVSLMGGSVMIAGMSIENKS